MLTPALALSKIPSPKCLNAQAKSMNIATKYPKKNDQAIMTHVLL